MSGHGNNNNGRNNNNNQQSPIPAIDVSKTVYFIDCDYTLMVGEDDYYYNDNLICFLASKTQTIYLLTNMESPRKMSHPSRHRLSEHLQKQGLFVGKIYTNMDADVIAAQPFNPNIPQHHKPGDHYEKIIRPAEEAFDELTQYCKNNEKDINILFDLYAGHEALRLWNHLKQKNSVDDTIKEVETLLKQAKIVSIVGTKLINTLNNIQLNELKYTKDAVFNQLNLNDIDATSKKYFKIIFDKRLEEENLIKNCNMVESNPDALAESKLQRPKGRLLEDILLLHPNIEKIIFIDDNALELAAMQRESIRLNVSCITSQPPLPSYHNKNTPIFQASDCLNNVDFLSNLGSVKKIIYLQWEILFSNNAWKPGASDYLNELVKRKIGFVIISQLVESTKITDELASNTNITKLLTLSPHLKQESLQASINAWDQTKPLIIGSETASLGHEIFSPENFNIQLSQQDLRSNPQIGLIRIISHFSQTEPLVFVSGASILQDAQKANVPFIASFEGSDFFKGLIAYLKLLNYVENNLHENEKSITGKNPLYKKAALLILEILDKGHNQETFKAAVLPSLGRISSLVDGKKPDSVLKRIYHDLFNLISKYPHQNPQIFNPKPLIRYSRNNSHQFYKLPLENIPPSPEEDLYLLDVDNTFLAIALTDVIHNQNLINSLKKHNIHSICLLTNMDGPGLGGKLFTANRQQLISTLEKVGIAVKTVYTSRDVAIINLRKEAATKQNFLSKEQTDAFNILNSYQIGSSYSLNIASAENAVLELEKQFNPNELRKLWNSYHNKKTQELFEELLSLNSENEFMNETQKSEKILQDLNHLENFENTSNFVWKALVSAIEKYLKINPDNTLDTFITQTFLEELESLSLHDNHITSQLNIIYESNVRESILIRTCQTLSEALGHREIPKHEKSKLLNEIAEHNPSTKRIIFIDDSLLERNGFTGDASNLHSSIISTTFNPPFPSDLGWQCEVFAQTENHLMKNNDFCIPLEDFDKQLSQLTGLKKKVVYFEWNTLGTYTQAKKFEFYSKARECISRLISNNIAVVVLAGTNEIPIALASLFESTRTPVNFLTKELIQQDFCKLFQTQSLFVADINLITLQSESVNIINLEGKKNSSSIECLANITEEFLFVTDKKNENHGAPHFLSTSTGDLLFEKIIAYTDLQLYLENKSYETEGSHSFIAKQIAFALNNIFLSETSFPYDEKETSEFAKLKNIFIIINRKKSLEHNIIRHKQDNLSVPVFTSLLPPPISEKNAPPRKIVYIYLSTINCNNIGGIDFYSGAIECIGSLISKNICVAIINNLKEDEHSTLLRGALSLKFEHESVVTIDGNSDKRIINRSFSHKNLIIIDLNSFFNESSKLYNEVQKGKNNIISDKNCTLITYLLSITNSIPLLFIHESSELAEEAFKAGIPFLIAHPGIKDGKTVTVQPEGYAHSYASQNFFDGVLAYIELVLYVIERKYEKEEGYCGTKDVAIETCKKEALQLLNNLREGVKTSYLSHLSELTSIYNRIFSGIIINYRDKTPLIGGSSRVWDMENDIESENSFSKS